MKKAVRRTPQPPAPFTIARSLKRGRYPLLSVFPGLDEVAPFRRYPGPEKRRRELASGSFVEIVPRRGEWMYVAPHAMPPDPDPRWRPVISAEDCVVISMEHLRTSPDLVLYMDILHELLHVVQRKAGRELWDERFSYVDRPTEVEAYRFAVHEARRLGATDRFLQDYLRVEWVSEEDHQKLLRNVGVRPDGHAR